MLYRYVSLKLTSEYFGPTSKIGSAMSTSWICASCLNCPSERVTRLASVTPFFDFLVATMSARSRKRSISSGVNCGWVGDVAVPCARHGRIATSETISARTIERRPTIMTLLLSRTTSALAANHTRLTGRLAIDDPHPYLRRHHFSAGIPVADAHGVPLMDDGSEGGVAASSLGRRAGAFGQDVGIAIDGEGDVMTVARNRHLRG